MTSNAGGWCWRYWERGGELVTTPFWCHHADCREVEMDAAILPEDWWH